MRFVQCITRKIWLRDDERNVIRWLSVVTHEKQTHEWTVCNSVVHALHTITWDELELSSD